MRLPATALSCLVAASAVACPGTPEHGPELPIDGPEVDGTGASFPETVEEDEVTTSADDPDIEVTVGECAPGGADPVCDDDNPCTDDFCDASGSCAHLPNIALCDDGDLCSVFDRCSGGACSGTPLDCDDGSSCTDDRCDEGACVHEPRSSGRCDEGSLCTHDDRCDDGVCVGTEVVCPGAGPCADTRCEPRTGCELVPRGEGESCDDGDACTELTRCLEGVCRGSLVDCDDGDPCSDDYCDPLGAGCLHRDNRAPCDDGDPCTRDDRCDAGVCAGMALESCCADDCDDGDPCTLDRCEEAGCVNAPFSPLPPEGQLVEDFEGGLDAWVLSTSNDAVGWRVSTTWSASGQHSLYCGDEAESGYDHGATRARAAIRILVPPGDPALAFNTRREVGDAPSCVYDVLRVLADDQEVALVCASGEHETALSLAGFEGREVTLAFELDTVDDVANQGGGVWIDRLVLSASGCR